MEKYKKASKHIAVLAFPFGTHAAPLLSIILRLSEAFPAAMFSFLCTERSNSSTFPKGHQKHDSIKPFNVWDGLPEGYTHCLKRNPHEPVDYFLKAVPQNFKDAVDALVAETGRPIDCLITDAFYYFGAAIADELKVPWVALWTASPRALFSHAETEFFRRHVGINDPVDKPLDFLQGFASIRVADLPDGVVRGNFDASVPVLLNKMGLTLPRAAAVAANSYEDLDNAVVNMLKSRYKRFLNVGPSNLISACPVDDRHGCLDWLESHEPASVVYISFGSVITPPPHEIGALTQVLEESNFPFLWSFRGDVEKQLPPGFPKRTSSKGKIVPWAPQQKILEHPSVGVFVSHGGWNSILESISGGVPMVFRPFFGDQKLNTRTVETIWGFGLGLEGGTLTKEATTNALNFILSTEEGKKMRQKVEVQKELAYKAVQPNGSSIENFKTLVGVVTCHHYLP
ncbi:flavonoid 3-O-glucosyltransferase-like [Gossypium australe]|uniref:Glycosyltransferase n=1 Tax=Gossypium australe TaxID=47621 RepID=A0A5B6VP28_9ROSI|nr:flavonoid 3-O-glucosyltransferase-like [Gossypium australe]